MLVENLFKTNEFNKNHLESLLDVEKASWNEELKASLNSLKKRYEIYPQGYWVGKKMVKS